MQLQDLKFGGFERSWTAALTVATAWIPSLSGSYDSRVVQLRGQQLLAALVLIVLRKGGPKATMETVRQLIDEEMGEPGSILGKFLNDNIKEVRDIATACHASRGCWYGDAVPFLAMNITDERIEFVWRKWPRQILEFAQSE